MIALRNRWSIFGMLALTLVLVEYVVVSSPSFWMQPELLSLVVSIDIVAGIPLLYYFLLVRNGKSAAFRLLPVTALALLLTGLLLPAEHRPTQQLITYAVPLIEGAAVLLVLLKGRTLLCHYRTARHEALYPAEGFQLALARSFGEHRAARVFATEATLVYFSIVGWLTAFRAKRADLAVFSYHRAGGYNAIIAMVLPLVLMETVGVHIIVNHWSPTAAWILTALSIYTLVWLLGDFNAARLRPILIEGDTLHLRTGLRWSATLRREQIAAIRKPLRNELRRKDFLNMALAGEPQLILELHEPIVVEGLFGITRRPRLLGISVDDKRSFEEHLTSGQ